MMGNEEEEAEKRSRVKGLPGKKLSICLFAVYLSPPTLSVLYLHLDPSHYLVASPSSSSSFHSFIFFFHPPLFLFSPPHFILLLLLLLLLLFFFFFVVQFKMSTVPIYILSIVDSSLFGKYSASNYPCKVFLYFLFY